MRTAALCVASALALANAGALAQDVDDAKEKLRTCTLPSYAERMACLEKLSQDIAAAPAPPVAASPPSVAAPSAATPTPTPEPMAAPPSPPTPAVTVAPASGNWIVSETRSPIDYSPVAIATVSSSAGPDGGVLQLSIQCRGGRTEMVIRNAPLMRRAGDHVVTYAVNDSQPVAVAIGLSASGSGVALKGDVARFLASLPDQGDIAFRIVNPQGEAVEGRYALPGVKAVVGRMAGPCKWPIAAGTPRN